MTQLTYRTTVTPTDRDCVADIVVSTGFFNEEEVNIAVELVDERLAKGDVSGYFFVFAEISGTVVGYTCWGPISGTLASIDFYWIAVHESYRSQGIGRKLLIETEKAIAASGGQRIYVETSSREQYIPTRTFYEHSGYIKDAEIIDFYAPGDNKVLYLKVVK